MKTKSAFFLFTLLWISIHTNAQTWQPISSGVSQPVYLISPYKNVLLANAATRWTSSLQQWDGNSWSEFTDAPQPTALLIEGDTIWIGGNFTGGDNNKQMRLFDGTTWKTFGSLSTYTNIHWNTNYSYSSIFRYNNNLNIIAGEGLMKFDNTSQAFIKAGDMLSDLGATYTIGKPQLMKNKLYIPAYTNSGVQVLVWDDSKWDTLSFSNYTSPTGFGNGVASITSFNNEIYISGTFQKGSSYYSLLKYDGSTITEVMEFSLTGSRKLVKKFFPTKSYLFATYEDETNTTYLGMINGNTINQINNALTETINTVQTYNNEIYVGGDFTSIGGVAANYIAKTSLTTGMKRNNEKEVFVSIYPNPIHSASTLKISSSQLVSAQLKMYDMFGKEVKNISIEGNETKITKDLLSNGLYLYTIIENGQIIHSGKLIIE